MDDFRNEWPNIEADLFIDEDDTAIQAEHGIWETADGEEIHIKDMTTEHIQNALNLIRRKDNKLLLELYEKQFIHELGRRKESNHA